MRLPLNQPLSTFLLVLSILAIVLGDRSLQYGHAWLFHNSPPPFVSAVVAVVVAVVVRCAASEGETPVVVATGIDANKSDVGVVRGQPRRSLRGAHPRN